MRVCWYDKNVPNETCPSIDIGPVGPTYGPSRRAIISTSGAYLKLKCLLKGWYLIGYFLYIKKQKYIFLQK